MSLVVRCVDGAGETRSCIGLPFAVDVVGGQVRGRGRRDPVVHRAAVAVDNAGAQVRAAGLVHEVRMGAVPVASGSA